MSEETERPAARLRTRGRWVKRKDASRPSNTIHPTSQTQNLGAGEMQDFVRWANGGFTQGVAVLIAAWLCRLLVQRWKARTMESTEKWKRNSLKVALLVAQAIPIAMVLGFCTWQLAKQLMKTTPLERVDAFEISFWTFWVLLIWVRMLTGPFGISATHQPQGNLLRRYSSATADQSMSTGNQTSNPTTGPAKTGQHQAPGN